jgi:hypothetical protein
MMSSLCSNKKKRSSRKTRKGVDQKCKRRGAKKQKERSGVPLERNKRHEGSGECQK